MWRQGTRVIPILNNQKTPFTSRLQNQGPEEWRLPLILRRPNRPTIGNSRFVVISKEIAENTPKE
jgi:hypothetical protein